MIVLTEIRSHHISSDENFSHTLALTAEERTRLRLPYPSTTGEILHLQLPRGTILHHGDVLLTATRDQVVQVIAKPEPVITVTAPTPWHLLRAAYHLGNRHVPLEVKSTYLRLSPDVVLEEMLHHLGLELVAETAPFEPEGGAYGHTS